MVFKDPNIFLLLLIHYHFVVTPMQGVGLNAGSEEEFSACDGACSSKAIELGPVPGDMYCFEFCWRTFS